jgi:hypothetical protein
VYQSITSPVPTEPVNDEDAPAQIVDGVATTVGVLGSAFTITST